MTMDEKLRAAEIISNCKLPEALPYIVELLGLREVEEEVVEVEKCESIRKLMNEKGVNDTELARACGIERSVINKYRNGVHVPNDARYCLIINTLKEM